MPARKAAAVAGPPLVPRPCLAERNGIGRPAGPAAARRCPQRAADTGEAAAMFLLAQMLADGDGGVRDAVAAHAWLERAAGLDYPEALQALAHRAHEAGEVRRAARE